MKGLLSTPKRKVYLARHGQTKLNVKDNIRGWLDVPLDAKGMEQAVEMGKELKGKGIDYIITSDLTRALQTSLCISSESGIPIVATTIALRPWNVGKYTGEPASVVHPILYKMAIEEPDKAIEGGESFDSFRCRVLLGIISLLNEYKDCTILFVAHHRNDRLLRGWIEAGCPSDLEVDFDHFGTKGIPPGTFDEFIITSPLVI